MNTISFGFHPQVQRAQTHPVKKQPVAHFGMQQAEPDRQGVQGVHRAYATARSMATEILRRLAVAVVPFSLQVTVMWGNVGALRRLMNVVPEPARSSLLRRTTWVMNTTPVFLAILHGNMEALRVLLSAVPEQERATLLRQTIGNMGQTPIHYAAGQEEMEALKVLLNAVPAPERAALVSQADQFGNTPIHYTAGLRKMEALKVLLNAAPAPERAALVNQPNIAQQTPLQIIAASFPQAEQAGEEERCLLTALVLMVYGADPSQLADDFRNRVMNYANMHMKQQAATLVNPQATPEQVRAAMRWFQQFPRGGGALDWQAATAPCNAFLQQRLKWLTQPDLTGEGRLRILSRLRPILRSGLPLNQGSLNGVCAQATEAGYWPLIQDALAAGADHSVMGVAFLAKEGPTVPAVPEAQADTDRCDSPHDGCANPTQPARGRFKLAMDDIVRFRQ